jgi:hypothetical protein
LKQAAHWSNGTDGVKRKKLQSLLPYYQSKLYQSFKTNTTVIISQIIRTLISNYHFHSPISNCQIPDLFFLVPFFIYNSALIIIGMKRVFKIAILGFVLVSCQSESIRINSARIDSLLVIVDSLNQQMLSIDIDSVNTILSGCGELIEKMSMRDKVGAEKVEMDDISSLAGIKKSISRFVDKYPGFQKELAITEHQLITLQQDLVQKNLNDSLFQKYLGEEDAILSKLSKDIDNNIDWLQQKLFLYQKVYDKLKFRNDSIGTENEIGLN